MTVLQCFRKPRLSLSVRKQLVSIRQTDQQIKTNKAVDYEADAFTLFAERVVNIEKALRNAALTPPCGKISEQVAEGFV